MPRAGSSIVSELFNAGHLRWDQTLSISLPLHVDETSPATSNQCRASELPNSGSPLAVLPTEKKNIHMYHHGKLVLAIARAQTECSARSIESLSYHRLCSCPSSTWWAPLEPQLGNWPYNLQPYGIALCRCPLVPMSRGCRCLHTLPFILTLG